MADAAQNQKAAGSGSRALLWILILLLLGTVWWLASERNARKYTLSTHAGFLVVSRGHFFPTGTGAIGPDDPQGKLYAGIALPAGMKNFPEIEYDDENELDRGLYDMLSASSHALAKKGDAASFAEADELAKRLSGLRGLTAGELQDLTALRAELAFWSAGGDVQAAVALLATARRKLEEVRANGGEHAPAATILESELEPRAAELASLGARFAPPSTTVAGPNNSPPAGASAGAAAMVGMPITLPDGGAPAVVEPASVASPPGAPSTNTIVEPLVAPPRASAPSSVSSGASRGNQQ